MNKPDRDDIQPGKKVTLKSGETVLLIERVDGLYSGIPYIEHESENPIQAPTCYFWTRERWLVEFEDGFRTHRYIHFFLFIRTQYPSGYIYSASEADDYEDDEDFRELRKLYHIDDEEE